MKNHKDIKIAQSKMYALNYKTTRASKDKYLGPQENYSSVFFEQRWFDELQFAVLFPWQFSSLNRSNDTSFSQFQRFKPLEFDTLKKFQMLIKRRKNQ